MFAKKYTEKLIIKTNQNCHKIVNLTRCFVCLFIASGLSGCFSDFSPSLPSFSPKPSIASYRAISVQKGDTLYQISKRYDVNLRDLILVNHLQPPFHIRPGQGLRLPKKRIHIVRKFETVSSIAQSRDVSQNELVRINSLKPPYKLHENQKLALPSPYDDQQSIKKITTHPSLKAKQETITQKKQEKREQEQRFSPQDTSWKDEFVAPHDVSNQSDSFGDKKSPALAQKEPLKKPGHDSKRQNDKSKNRSSSTEFQYTEFLYDVPPTKPRQQQRSDAPPSVKTAKKDIHTVTKGKTTSSPKTTKVNAKAPLHFTWPLRGKIISRYGALQSGLKNDGINVKAPLGAAVRAAESGTIVYTGNALKGYGNLILMRHRQGFISTYAHLKSVSIHKGQTVRKGQILGYVGTTGSVKTPQLHFEIRKKRQTLDPLTLLK